MLGEEQIVTGKTNSRGKTNTRWKRPSVTRKMDKSRRRNIDSDSICECDPAFRVLFVLERGKSFKNQILQNFKLRVNLRVQSRSHKRKLKSLVFFHFQLTFSLFSLRRSSG
jgi:hypothetical protein